MPSEQTSFKRLIDIGISLSSEKDTDRLMEIILLEAKDIGNADGGTLYLRTEEDTLKFEIMRTDSLNIAQGGTTGIPVTLPPVQMYGANHQPNMNNIVSYAAISGKTVNIEDAYASEEFDFSGTRKFDESTGFRSTSFLTVPMKNKAGTVIGVLQLLNARKPDTDIVSPFEGDIQPLIEALASQAAVALDNAILIEAQKELMQAIIELMAGAVDAKSPYTGGHCQRVPELTKMLAKAACESTDPVFADFDLDEEQWYELHIGAWLHDCGKVTTPEYVVDKATKLETITDRIHEVRMRFEIVKREAVIECQKKIIAGGNAEQLNADLDSRLAKIDDDYSFIANCNMGGEFMAEELVERVKQIAATKWTRTLDDRLGVSTEELERMEREPARELPCQEDLLADRIDHLFEHDNVVHSADPENPYGFKVDVPEHKFNKGEVYNLSIARGTLTAEERFKINDHIMQTIVMLESLPFPKHLENVPKIAGGHHETMDGKGYPKRLSSSDMSIPSRIMAIADVFEALTAADRPYKLPKTLSGSVKIMSFMVKDNHLDGDLFKLFLESGAYKDYADAFLSVSQIDDVDVSEYL
jgi:HD-GYP domain-containing protein (c-di-GMP phosphodiesterase class II)